MGELLLGAPRYGRDKTPRDPDPGKALQGGEIYLSMPGLGDRLAGEIGEHFEQYATPNAPANARDHQSPEERFNSPRRLGGHMIAAYILIQAEAGKAAIVAAALRDLPGVTETAIVAGPCDVIARAQARDIDELGKLVASQVRALDGVTRTLSCPVVHL
jgi:hypothetical protein